MTRFGHRRHATLLLHVLVVLPAGAAFLFRRRGHKPARDDAFQDLFASIADVYEAAARLKPEWRDQWRDRRDTELPPKYQFENDIAVAAAHDMRFATALLLRNRWKSVVQPLFDSVDEHAWTQFQATATSISPRLMTISDARFDCLREDEQDWIAGAVEQFDDATRRRKLAAADGTTRHRAVAEGTYLPVHIAIQLSERLIERLRADAAERR